MYVVVRITWWETNYCDTVGLQKRSKILSMMLFASSSILLRGCRDYTAASGHSGFILEQQVMQVK